MGMRPNVLLALLLSSLLFNVSFRRNDIERVLSSPQGDHAVNSPSSNSDSNERDIETNDNSEGGRDLLSASFLNSTLLQEMIQKEITRLMANMTFTKTTISDARDSGNGDTVKEASTMVPTEPKPQTQQPPQPPQLPSCKAIMQAEHSPFKDGAFLTRHTVPVVWIPRMDGSRELRHSMCQLHRYTAHEAKQCLAGKHLSMIGDSLTRYQYLSLAWFLHKASYPPRFGLKRGPTCTHIDEHGNETCSPKGEPNICMEGDWRSGVPKGREDWTHYMQSVGGDEIFGGHMESVAIRSSKLKAEQSVENSLYVSPPISGTRPKQNHDNSLLVDDDKLVLSYVKENGFGKPLPIIGWNFTGCAFHGNCTYPDSLADQREALAQNDSFDFRVPLVDAIDANNNNNNNNKHGGLLHQILPPVDIVLYNRGLWGGIQPDLAQRLFPLLHSFSQGDKGKCFFRSTTGRFETTLERERNELRSHSVLRPGCGYMDFAHLLEDFNTLTFFHPAPPGQAHYDGGEKRSNDKHKKKSRTVDNMDERRNVYWDLVHFQPWVYEELNNMLLNVLCNAQE